MVSWLHKSLAAKLFLTVLAATLPVVALMLGLLWFSLGNGFYRYISLVELSALQPVADSLTTAYRSTGSWAFLPTEPASYRAWLREVMAKSHDPQELAEHVTPQPPPPPPFMPPGDWGRPPPPPPPPRLPPRDHLSLTQRTAVLDAEGHLLAGPPQALPNHDRMAVRVAGAVVGWVVLWPADIAPPEVERQFLRDQRWNLVVIGLFSLMLSALAGWMIARSLLRPIRALVTGTHRLAEGAYDTRLDQTRLDEFGELARAFNQLGQALAEHETSRRRWVADTSHELRTPIAVLRAQIEAMQDGIHHTSPEKLGVLHSEVMGLSRLVDDLYTLARADVGGLQMELVSVDPVMILDEVLEGFEQRLARAGLDLVVTGRPATTSCAATPWIGQGDPVRLRQLFVNIIENSARYTYPGGTISITIIAGASALSLCFDDSAPGVPASELPRLFERFYRVEASRSREQGGSGLGLAICRGIVEAHGGTITAAASPLGGLRMEVVLPLRPQHQGAT